MIWYFTSSCHEFCRYHFLRVSIWTFVWSCLCQLNEPNVIRDGKMYRIFMVQKTWTEYFWKLLYYLIGAIYIAHIFFNLRAHLVDIFKVSEKCKYNVIKMCSLNWICLYEKKCPLIVKWGKNKMNIPVYVIMYTSSIHTHMVCWETRFPLNYLYRIRVIRKKKIMQKRQFIALKRHTMKFLGIFWKKLNYFSLLRRSFFKLLLSTIYWFT